MIYLGISNCFEGDNEKVNRQKWRLRAYDNFNNFKEMKELISDLKNEFKGKTYRR